MGTKFSEVSYCWLDNKVFGHTAIYVGTFTDSVGAYKVRLSHVAYEEWMMVAVITDTAHDYLDWISHLCPVEPAQPGNLTRTGTIYASHTGDLAIFAFALGRANGSATRPTCSSGTAFLLGPCYSPVSGLYGQGTTYPALAEKQFSGTGANSATIFESGGVCGTTGCLWMSMSVGVSDDN